MSKKLYWTDHCDDDIEVFDPATGDRRVLIRTGSSSAPRAIVLDPSTRYVGLSLSVIGVYLWETSAGKCTGQTPALFKRSNEHQWMEHYV